MPPISKAPDNETLNPVYFLGKYFISANVEKFSNISGIGLKGVPQVSL